LLPYSRYHSRSGPDLVCTESLLIPLVCLVCGNTQICHLKNKRGCDCFINHLPFRSSEQCQSQIYEALGKVMWRKRAIEHGTCGHSVVGSRRKACKVLMSSMLRAGTEEEQASRKDIFADELSVLGQAERGMRVYYQRSYSRLDRSTIR